MFSGIAAVREGSQPPWSPTWLCGFELTNKIIGIYGTLACLMLCLALQQDCLYQWYIGLPDGVYV